MRLNNFPNIQSTPSVMTLIIYSIGNDTKLKRDAVLIYFYNTESID